MGVKNAYETRVIGNLCRLSASQEYQIAKREWDAKPVQYGYGSCDLCHKTAIRWLFPLTNQHNGNEIIVGSECIENFLEVDGRDHDAMVKFVTQLFKDGIQRVEAEVFEESFPWAKRFLLEPSYSEIRHPRAERIWSYFQRKGKITENQRNRVLAWAIDATPTQARQQVATLKAGYLVTTGEAEGLLLEQKRTHQYNEAFLLGRVKEAVQAQVEQAQYAFLEAATGCPSFSDKRKDQYRDIWIRRAFGGEVTLWERNFLERVETDLGRGANPLPLVPVQELQLACG